MRVGRARRGRGPEVSLKLARARACAFAVPKVSRNFQTLARDTLVGVDLPLPLNDNEQSDKYAQPAHSLNVDRPPLEPTR
ncbi:hypothetical protein EVAR_44000_1 [Eumeta japonica]|uniref:Uncharacterized protein n=1 Tax=Eumeta variegata TaxID=151549 RepID=A0A4C1XGW6_EUMVA|nr:hypothetical protein EVAR_44000_1 [Eumeta japonica]